MNLFLAIQKVREVFDVLRNTSDDNRNTIQRFYQRANAHNVLPLGLENSKYVWLSLGGKPTAEALAYIQEQTPVGYEPYILT